MADKAVFGIAGSEAQAIVIANNLRAAGFRADDISVLLPDKAGTRDFAHEQHTKAPEGATVGGAGGAILGGAVGWLVGIGSLAIPGLGPFVAAGPIMAALAGAAGVGTAGGIIGGLIGMGVPEYEAKRYEGRLRDRNILISIHTENSGQRDAAEKILQAGGAEDISYTGEAGVPRDQRRTEPRY
jgi:hypothetical protein